MTSARDQVVKLGTLSAANDAALPDPAQGRKQWGGPAADVAQAEPVSARKQWGRPGSTVLRALQEAPMEGTCGSDKSGTIYIL